MRKILLYTAFLFVLSVRLVGQVHVHGYFNSYGKWVEPYHRTSPDNSIWNNYSIIGNTNPYTGQAGTVNPYGGNGTYNVIQNTNGYYGSEIGSVALFAPNNNYNSGYVSNSGEFSGYNTYRRNRYDNFYMSNQTFSPGGLIIPNFNSNSFMGQIINDALNKLLNIVLAQKSDTTNGKKENVVTKAKHGLAKLSGKLSQALNK